ncbi:MAG: MFS transporter, partial [Candidatus Hinthialibacter sp.]
SERFFSTIWLIGVGVEILLTFNLHHLTRRLGLKRTFVIGFTADSLRWCGLSLLDAPGWILLLSVMHGPSVIGIFFASAMYLDAKCEESVRSTAQALLYFSFVTGQMTGYILASALVDYYGYLPRADAIQSSFFWFGLFSFTAAIIAGAFLPKESRNQ